MSHAFFWKCHTCFSNTKSMTLGPTFYTKLVSSITRHRKYLNQQIQKISEALDELYTLAVSKRNWKHSGTFFRKCACDLGYAAYETLEKTSLNTPVNTPVNTPANAPVSTWGNTSVNTSVNTPVDTWVNALVNATAQEESFVRPNVSFVGLGQQGCL